jgi:hypothetical protein
LHAVTWPVHELVTEVLQLLPHVLLFVQHMPSSPAVTAMPPALQVRPPVHGQVSPVVSPGKRGNAAFGLVLQSCPLRPFAM